MYRAKDVSTMELDEHPLAQCIHCRMGWAVALYPQAQVRVRTRHEMEMSFTVLTHHTEVMRNCRQ